MPTRSVSLSISCYYLFGLPPNETFHKYSCYLLFLLLCVILVWDPISELLKGGGKYAISEFSSWATVRRQNSSLSVHINIIIGDVNPTTGKERSSLWLRHGVQHALREWFDSLSSWLYQRLAWHPKQYIVFNASWLDYSVYISVVEISCLDGEYCMQLVKDIILFLYHVGWHTNLNLHNGNIVPKIFFLIICWPIRACTFQLNYLVNVNVTELHQQQI